MKINYIMICALFERLMTQERLRTVENAERYLHPP